jgi:hypothetical protein
VSIFEFVLIPLAIIIGLSVSEILASWGQQIRTRHRRDLHALQIASSAFTLFFCMSYLWAMWLMRDITWTFPLYILVAVPGFALALAAHISRVDTSADAPPTLEQYFQNSRPVYAILALIPISLIALSIVSGVRNQVPDPPNLVAITIVRVAMLLLIVSLAWSQSPKYHAAALAALWISILGVTARLAFRIVEAAA